MKDTTKEIIRVFESNLLSSLKVTLKSVTY